MEPTDLLWPWQPSQFTAGIQETLVIPLKTECLPISGEVTWRSDAKYHLIRSVENSKVGLWPLSLHFSSVEMQVWTDQHNLPTGTSWNGTHHHLLSWRRHDSNMAGSALNMNIPVFHFSLQSWAVTEIRGSGVRTEIDHKSRRYAIISTPFRGLVGVLQMKKIRNNLWTEDCFFRA